MARIIVICLIMACFFPLVQGQILAALNMINTALKLVSMGIEIGNLLSKTTNSDIYKKVDELDRTINDLKNYVTVELSDLKNLILEEIFFNYLRGLTDEVSSCLEEYEHLKANLNDTGMKANFWNQCKDIITPLRALGKILVGEAVMGKDSLMKHLDEKEGFCNAVTMNGVFSYIFEYLTEGSVAFTMAQTYKHGNTSKIYEEEFRKTFDEIRTQYTLVFQNCRVEICSLDFQPKIKHIIKIKDTLNDTYFQLREELPYLEFFIVRIKSDSSSPPNPTSHDIKYVELSHDGTLYRVCAIKSNTVSNTTGPLYKLIEYRPANLLDYEFRGMKVHQICEEGMSMCAFKIYVNGTDADCFSGQDVPTANGLVLSPFVVVLSISFGIVLTMEI